MTAAVLSVGLLLSLFAMPAAGTVMVLAGVFTVSAWEWSSFGGLTGRSARAAYTLAVVVLLAVCWHSSQSPSQFLMVLGAACLWWVIALTWIILAPARQHPILALFCGVPVLVPAFVAVARILVAVRGFADDPQMVLWLLLMVFAADIGAFFVGRSLGRHKLAPRVSPGKTWEGAVGGIAAVTLVAVAGVLRFGFPVGSGIAFGCAVGIFSIIGDLTESMFKRAAGLKDSGTLLPGHGGVLDRIDGVTAAAPLYALGLFGSGVVA